MGLQISIEKVEDAHNYVLYAFGPPGSPVARVRLYKSSADIELASLSKTSDDADPRYYLAQAVPRLRSYQERDLYPDADRWEV